MGNSDNPIRILHTDALEGLRSVETGSVQACVTSPPFYLLRRYGTTTNWPDGWEGELGHEGHPNDFVRHLLNVFDEVWRALRDDGCLWVNLADTFNNKQGKKGTTNAPNGSSGRFAAGGKGYAQALREQPEFFKHYVTGIAHKSEMGVPQRFHLGYDRSRLSAVCRRCAGAAMDLPAHRLSGRNLWLGSNLRRRKATRCLSRRAIVLRAITNFFFSSVNIQIITSIELHRCSVRASARKGDRANAGSVWQTSAGPLSEVTPKSISYGESTQRRRRIDILPCGHRLLCVRCSCPLLVKAIPCSILSPAAAPLAKWPLIWEGKRS